MRRGKEIRGVLIALVAGLLLTGLSLGFPYLLVTARDVALTGTGGLTFDPRLPLLSGGFALLGRGDAAAALGAKLDGLLGTTGLDPLDPNQPLQKYEIEGISLGLGDWAHGTVRMVYADGSSRRYRIPVVQSTQSWGRPGGWAYTGLDRYYAPHRELPDIPFAGDNAPVRLGAPERLPLTQETHQLGTGLLVEWYTSGTRLDEEMVWSPDGRAFLLTTRPDPRDRQTDTQLWLVDIGGENAVRLATNAEEYTWSRDGGQIAFLRVVHPLAPGPRQAWEVVVVNRDGQEERVRGRTDLANRPLLIGDAVWYLSGDGLWQAPLSGAEAIKVMELPGLAPQPGTHVGFAASVDGRRFAYRCADRLCLVDPDRQEVTSVELAAPRQVREPAPAGNGPGLSPVPTPPPPATVASGAGPGPVPTAPPAERPPAGPLPQRPGFARLALAWSPDGSRLAAVASDFNYNNAAMPTLSVVDSGGRLLRRAVIGPNGLTGQPQWTPDGRWIFLNTFPQGGRRIFAIEAASGSILDLSQSRWDTFFSLAPDGRRLLLWNGRGGFWTVDLSFN
ncbi:MAG: hypothetical protein Q8P00_03095 [Dehalococcoidia bacterium]|nr:hypothetical protein [Dehalococcoidia bacterium]